MNQWRIDTWRDFIDDEDGGPGWLCGDGHVVQIVGLMILLMFLDLFNIVGVKKRVTR